MKVHEIPFKVITPWTRSKLKRMRYYKNIKNLPNILIFNQELITFISLTYNIQGKNEVTNITSS